MEQNIVIKAGPKAIKHIREHGLNPKDIKTISAAAGGPKWFVIYHLTRYIAENILPHTVGQINLLGASVGGWQMACMAAKEPGAALERLRDYYAGETYALPVEANDISRGCKAVLDQTFSNTDIDYIVNNAKVNLNIFAAKGRGVINKNRKANVYIGLFLNYITNSISRKNIDLIFRRYIFSSQNEMPIDLSRSILKTELRHLDKDNIRSILMATAAIPLVMNGVENVPSLEGEVFWDGGLTDYHMTLPYSDDGLVIIPHFLPELTPGWMDKRIKRRGKGEDLQNVVLIHPSESYVQSLPKGKITTRDDFLDYGEDQAGRAAYWTDVSERGNVLATELDELIKSGKISDVITEL